jgi:sugar lactone lactonase YvrE
MLTAQRPSDRRTLLSPLTLLLVLPAMQAQVTAAPTVVADAQIGYALTASGSPISLSHPKGIAVAPDGTIYVADSSGSRIVEISTKGEISESPATNPAKIGGSATFLIPPGGLSDPNAVAVGPDGTLYFSDIRKKVLYRVTNPESGSPGYTQLTYSASQEPSALAVDPMGDLWVADAAQQQIVEFAPGATTATQKASVKPMIPTGIAVSANAVYFADANTNAIYGEGSKTPLLSSFAGRRFDFAADQADSTPTGLGLDGAGNLFVLDAANRRVVEFNPDQPSTVFLIPFSGQTAPASMAVGPTGNLYLADDSQQQLTELIYDGNPINFGAVPARANSSTVTVNYSFNAPVSAKKFHQAIKGDDTGDFVFDNNECLEQKIQAGDTCQQQVHVNFKRNTPGVQAGVIALSNAEGEVLAPLAVQADLAAAILSFFPGTLSPLVQGKSGFPTLLEPQAVAISGNGRSMFVADEGGEEVNGVFTYTQGKVWDYPMTTAGLPTGTAPTQVGGKEGDGKPGIISPIALALDGAGNVYVADYVTGAVYIAAADKLGTANQLKITGVTLDHPIALAFDAAGNNLYIGDTGPAGTGASTSSPGFVVKVPLSGGGAATKLDVKVGTAPVIYPEALAVDTSGNLYIADGGDGITTFGDLVLAQKGSQAGTEINTGSTVLNEPGGLAFDAANNLYVLNGYSPALVLIPVTIHNNGNATTGTATAVPQPLTNNTSNINIVTGAGLAIWPSGQEITLTDIGPDPSAPVTQVVFLKTQSASLAFGPIPVTATAPPQDVLAVNVGNETGNLFFTQSGQDPNAFFTVQNLCDGGQIAAGATCLIPVTYQPDQLGTTTAAFNIFVNQFDNFGATASNFINVTGTSTAFPTVTTINVASGPQPFNPTIFVTISGGNFTTLPGPLGPVEILFNGVVVGTGQAFLGLAAITFNQNLPVGTDTLTAVYAANGNFAGSTSAPVNVVVTAPTHF